MENPAKSQGAPPEELEARLEVVERLQRTLIALLSARNPSLLDELLAVFEASDFADDRAGRAASSTWARIAGELESTRTLIEDLRDPDGR